VREGVEPDWRDEALLYRYDGASRLISSRKDGATTAYAYDAAGNLTQEKQGRETTDYTYDAANRLTAKNDAAGQTLYSYDANGNLTGTRGPQGQTTYRYTNEGRLAEGANEKGEISRYTYNALGQRVRLEQERENFNAGHQNVRTDSGSAHLKDYYLPVLSQDRAAWQKTWETAAGAVVQNNPAFVVKEYVPDYAGDPGHDLTVYEAGAYVRRYTYDGDGARVSGHFTYAPGTRRGEAGENPGSDFAADLGSVAYRRNLAGSSVYALRGDGAVAAHMTYDDWGKPETEPKTDVNYAGLEQFNDYGGCVYDEVLDLYYAQNRFYDPADRRWISPDPHWGPENMRKANLRITLDTTQR
jgi:RHS repeat-associated protein